MKKNIIRNLVLSASVLTFAAGLALTVSSNLFASGEEWNDVAIEEEYLCGSSFTVPSRTVSANGKEAAATAVLTYPDGTTSMLAEIRLDMTGRYTLTYSAFLNGKTYQTTENFHVYQKVATVGASSSVEYGRHPSSERTDGLMVRLAQNDSLKFSTIIDLRESTTEQSVVELFVTPDRLGVMDFAKIIFTLTDVEDPGCFLRVSARQSWDGVNYPYSYYLAGGNGQPMEGWEGAPWNKLHVNNDWGTPAEHSFYGSYPNGNTKLDRSKISVYYDAATKCVYAGGSRVFVIDLDNPQYFNKPWSGFTSGKVRLSVSADVYSGSTANFVVSRVKDTDLSAEKLEDAVAPEITVNTSYAEMPVAKTWLAYNIPTATAKDDYSGECAVEISVYRNYTSETPIPVSTANGTFTPTAAGRYAIVYRTTDHEGNESKKILWVEAKNDVSAPVVELPADRTEHTLAGIFVPVGQAITSGGSGDLQTKITVRVDGEEVEFQEGGFRPRRMGSYVVEYTVTDYLGQTGRAQYTVTVDKGDKPVFETEPVLPLYYLSGCEYDVPVLIASDYTSGALVERPATVMVTDSSGEHEVSGKFTPTVSKSGDTVVIKFTARAAEIVKEIPAIRPIEADGERMRIQIGNYFVTDGAQVSLGDNSATVTANATNGSFMFANALLAEEFTATLHGIPARSSFGGLKIELIDSVDRTVSICAELVYAGGVTALRADGKQIGIAAGFAQSAETNKFEFGYASGAVRVGTATLNITHTAAGKEFKGFSSDLVYLRISFIDAQENAAYEISELNSQPIMNASSDRIRPKIVLTKSYGGTAALNEEVIVPRGVAGDVLDPVVSFSVTVLDPDGNAVVSTDGIKLENVDPNREYTFKAEKYGNYQVTYSATDSFSEKTQLLGYIVLSEDREPPTFQFDRDFPTAGKVGEPIVIPNFTVSDNVTASENLIVTKYVRTASGMLVSLPQSSNSFRPTGAGEYTFIFTALDEAGNFAVLQLKVQVAE